jgi:hypothetical protein
LVKNSQSSINLDLLTRLQKNEKRQKHAKA